MILLIKTVFVAHRKEFVNEINTLKNFKKPSKQYNTIQILLSTRRRGVSETIEIIKRLKNTQKLSINNY